MVIVTSTYFFYKGHKPHLDESSAAVVGDLYHSLSESMARTCRDYSNERYNLYSKLPILRHDRADFWIEPLDHYGKSSVLTSTQSKNDEDSEEKSKKIVENTENPEDKANKSTTTSAENSPSKMARGRQLSKPTVKDSRASFKMIKESRPLLKGHEATHYVFTSEEKNLLIKHALNADTQFGHQVHDFGVLEMDREHFTKFMSEAMFAPTAIADKVLMQDSFQ
jgi:hypothetical protein